MCNGKSVTQLDARTYVFRIHVHQSSCPSLESRASKVHSMGFTAIIPTGNQDNVRYISFFPWFDFPCSIECIQGAVLIDTNGMKWKSIHAQKRRHFYILYQIIISSVTEISWHYNVNCHPVERIVQLQFPQLLCVLFVTINSSMRLHFIRSPPPASLPPTTLWCTACTCSSHNT